MGATSIHVQAVKPGSEIHNFREKELDYVRPELSHLNESWVGDSISHRLESAKQRYFDTVGQKMQTKAAPIREGVIVIKQETTMQELQQFAAVCKERFGIEAFQIHIHKDEGYMNAKQWTPNLHAHVVFDWTQPNGKSVRLSRDDMAELQTIASEALGMERGVSSDRKHLSAMQYKTECAKEQLQELSNDISSALDKHKDVQNQLLQLQKELRSIETKKNVQKLISKASEKFYGLIGKTVNDREKDALKAKIKALEGENEQLSDRLGKAILEKERNGTKVFKAENDKEYYRQQMDNARTTSNRLRTENQELKTETKELKKELGKMKDLFNFNKNGTYTRTNIEIDKQGNKKEANIYGQWSFGDPSFSTIYFGGEHYWDIDELTKNKFSFYDRSGKFGDPFMNREYIELTPYQENNTTN